MTRRGDFKVTLLGTGTPIPRKDRFGQCTLISAVARIKRPGAKVDHKSHNAQKK
jgi:predicted P-loop ATPase